MLEGFKEVRNMDEKVSDNGKVSPALSTLYSSWTFYPDSLTETTRSSTGSHSIM